MPRALYSLILALALFYTPAFGQDLDPDRLETLSEEQAREAAREAELRKNRDTVRGEIKGLQANLTALARDALKLERESEKTATELRALEQQHTELSQRIVKDRTSLTQLLAALQRIENNPPPALAVSPGDAAQAARAGKLMTRVSLDLQARTSSLKEQITKLNVVKANIQAKQEELTRSQTALDQKQASIKSVVSQKSALEKSISDDQAKAKARMEALAAEADTLRELIEQFEQAAQDVVPRLKPKPGETSRPAPSRPKLSNRGSAPRSSFRLPQGAPSFDSLQGKLTQPVTGRLTKTYSSARKGLTVTTREKAQVVAVSTARVEFAGPFKNYENVVILNAGDGYFVLLTGLGDIYSTAGDIVTPGEPIGLMPFNTQSAPELYIEFRKNGTTINPTPWLGTAFAR